MALTTEEQAIFDELQKKAGGQRQLSDDKIIAAFREMQNNNKTLANQLGAIERALKEGVQNKVEEEPVVDDKDLENLSRAEFAQYLIGTIQKGVIEPIKEERKQDTVRAQQADLARQAKEVHDKYADFNSWHDEMRDNIKAHPGMTIERAYKLARAENPEKAEEVDVETGKKEKEREGKVKKAAPKEDIIFGGLTPTSTLTSSSNKENGGMSVKEAANAAWDSVQMGEHLAAIAAD
jgi:hypothetical protein